MIRAVKSLFNKGCRRPGIRDKMISLRQLAVLLNSGVPLLRSLEVLDQPGAPASLRQAWKSVLYSVAQGNSLARSMARHGQVFGLLEIGMVRAAERTSHLDSALRYLADLLEGEYKLRRAVAAALHYPLFLLGAAFLGMLLFTAELMPLFAQGLPQDVQLPWITRCLLGTAEIFSTPKFCLFFSGAALGGVWAGTAYMRTPRGRYRWQKWQMGVYGAGRIIKKALVTRFCQTFAVLLRSGMPLPLCLEVAGDALDNYHLAEAVRAVNSGIKDGCTLEESFAGSAFFPRFVSQMLAIGTEAGNPADALDYVARIYSRQVEAALEQFLQLLEPVMLLLIGAFLTVMMLAMFLPLYQGMSVL